MKAIFFSSSQDLRKRHQLWNRGKTKEAEGSSFTCTVLNGVELRAGRAASSCDPVRFWRKGRPSTGRSSANSESRPELSEEGTCNSGLFSTNLEIWKQKPHNVILIISINYRSHRGAHLKTNIDRNMSGATIRLGILSPLSVQFRMLFWMTCRAELFWYTSRSFGSAKHVRFPSLKLQTSTHLTAINEN